MKNKYSLIGVNRNSFAIMRYVSRVLKRERLRDLVDEYTEKAEMSDYDNLLQVSMEYIDKANEKARETGEDWYERTT